MAGSEKKEQELALELRRSLENAYAFVEGQKGVASFAALTFEDLLDQQIEKIEGKASPLRPNQLDRIKKIEQDVLAAVAKVKSLPPEFFSVPDEEKDVNTPTE